MTDNGRLDIDGDHAVITFQRRLPHPIDVVWAALTDPEQRAAWFGPGSLHPQDGIDLMPTAPAPPDARRVTGRILTWEPPHVLEHEWRQQIVEDSVVRYELTADGDETVLTFTHRGLSARNAKGFIPGTHAFLDRLGAHLAGEPIPSWGARYAEVAPEYS